MGRDRRHQMMASRPLRLDCRYGRHRRRSARRKKTRLRHEGPDEAAFARREGVAPHQFGPMTYGCSRKSWPHVLSPEGRGAVRGECAGRPTAGCRRGWRRGRAPWAWPWPSWRPPSSGRPSSRPRPRPCPRGPWGRRPSSWPAPWPAGRATGRRRLSWPGPSWGPWRRLAPWPPCRRARGRPGSGSGSLGRFTSGLPPQRNSSCSSISSRRLICSSLAGSRLPLAHWGPLLMLARVPVRSSSPCSTLSWAQPSLPSGEERAAVASSRAAARRERPRRIMGLYQLPIRRRMRQRQRH